MSRINFLQDPQGELKNKNVLIVRESIEETAKHFDLNVDVIKGALSKGREILFEERLTRPKPHLDTKMVTSWNGWWTSLVLVKDSCFVVT